jgi:ATP-binding cassette subfamily B protein
VVAYRKATIGLADEVLHLSDGRVVDRGTHQELLDRSPVYADLVNAYEVEPAGQSARPSGGEEA